MSVKPLNDFVAVKKDEAAKQSDGGIFLAPSTTDEKVVTGVVLAVGPGRVTESGQVVDVRVAVGAKVCFHKSSAVEVKVGGELVTLVREEQLLAVLG